MDGERRHVARWLRDLGVGITKSKSVATFGVKPGVVPVGTAGALDRELPVGSIDFVAIAELGISGTGVTARQRAATVSGVSLLLGRPYVW